MLRELADDIEQAGREAERAGDTAWAMRCYRWAMTLRQLTAREYSPRVKGDMNDVHREAISKGRTGRSPMMRAARKAGVAKTQAELAAALGMKPNFLSAIVHGAKKMPQDKQALLEKLTGYRWEA